LPEAVTRAKEFITQAIAGSVRAGRHPVLNWFWQYGR
jgi:hydroxymethylpyrimidine/phosphomethylpyrimidine kinase